MKDGAFRDLLITAARENERSPSGDVLACERAIHIKLVRRAARRRLRSGVVAFAVLMVGITVGVSLIGTRPTAVPQNPSSIAELQARVRALDLQMTRQKAELARLLETEQAEQIAKVSNSQVDQRHHSLLQHAKQQEQDERTASEILRLGDVLASRDASKTDAAALYRSIIDQFPRTFAAVSAHHAIAGIEKTE